MKNRMMSMSAMALSVAVVAALVSPAVFAADLKKDMRKMGESVKHGTEKVGASLKHGTEKVGHAFKKGGKHVKKTVKK